MKKLLLILLLPMIGFGQTDTIFSYGKKISCFVKEINSTEVKFIYPREDFINVFNKNAIQKIVFKSGRIETYESSALPYIKDISEFQDVVITEFESDVKGLYRIGIATSKAKGLTALANMKKIQDRAIRKIKTFAAMSGSNIIYVTDMNIIGNRSGSKYSPGTKTSTNVTGICYTSELLNINDFKKLINQEKNYVVYKKFSLRPNDYKYQEQDVDDSISIQKVYIEKGFIYLEAVLRETDQPSKNDPEWIKKSKPKFKDISEKFKVIRFNNEEFTIMWMNKDTIINATIKL